MTAQAAKPDKPTIQNHRGTVPAMDAETTLENKSDGFDIVEALRLKFKRNWTFQMIADHLGVPRATIHYRLQSVGKLFLDKGLNRAYAEHRAEFLGGLERVLVEQMLDQEKLKSASLNNVAYAFQQVHNARRLEQDLSTANVATRSVRDLSPEARGRLDQALAAMYDSPESTPPAAQNGGHRAEGVDNPSE